MANLTIRRENTPGAVVPERGYYADPFQTMRELMQWEPFSELGRAWPTEKLMTFNPDFDLKETPEAFILKADVPGVLEKDVEISLSGNRLIITGKRETEHEEKSDTYYRSERSYGTFTRSFVLPYDVDAAHCVAELKAGVLQVQLPKVQTAQVKKIQIKAGEKKS